MEKFRRGKSELILRDLLILANSWSFEPTAIRRTSNALMFDRESVALNRGYRGMGQFGATGATGYATSVATDRTNRRPEYSRPRVASGLSQQIRQLRDIGRDPPRLIPL
jgi:hypothetical protein